MSTTMEVNQRQQRNCGLNILLLLCGGQLFGGGVVAVDVCLVVVLVVKLHDLARDRGLERAIVIYPRI